jgi:hypothetical protein
MKILTYKVMGYTGVYNPEIKEVEQIECLATMVVECPTQAILEEKEEIAKAEAYNGEYIIEDDGQPDPTSEPTQLDCLEAQIAYLAMMTGNKDILEV